MKLRYLNTTGTKSLLFLIAFSAPALAGWQETQWGMTEAEVSSMFPDSVISDGTVTIQGYPVLGYPETIILQFNEDGLGQVRLDVDILTCRSILKHHLVLRYGQPLTADVTSTMSSTRTETYWVDPENENMVIHHLVEGGSAPTCSIVYTPIPEKNAVGGL